MNGLSISCDIAAYAGWSDKTEETPGTALPRQMKRRLSPIGQTALSLAMTLQEAENARYIFTSRHGEFSRTLRILKSLAASEELSPTDFSMSVLHALASTMSIQQHNHAGHVALAAGSESLCFGFIEAQACLAENPAQSVLLLHYDELLPECYTRFEEETSPAVLALLLRSSAENRLTFSMTTKNSAPQTNIPAALGLWQFLKSRAVEFTYHGATHDWQWTRNGMV